MLFAVNRINFEAFHDELGPSDLWEIGSPKYVSCMNLLIPPTGDEDSIDWLELNKIVSF